MVETSLMLAEQRRLADLVDDAAGRAAAEQHRGRAAQHLDPVEVEDVALVERGVADAVDEDVAAGGEREAAQADVFLAALGRLEGDAGGVVQRLLHGVDAAVFHQLLGDDGHRLRDVAQLLVAAADRAGRRPHRVLVGLGLGLDGDRLQHRAVLGRRAARRGGRGRRGGRRGRAGATWASAATLNRPKPAASAPSGSSRCAAGGRGSEVTSGWSRRGRCTVLSFR